MPRFGPSVRVHGELGRQFRDGAQDSRSCRGRHEDVGHWAAFLRGGGTGCWGRRRDTAAGGPTAGGGIFAVTHCGQGPMRNHMFSLELVYSS